MNASTREQIIDTAHELLLQRGVNGFSYRDIAEPLGVKNAAIHYHFPAKKDLVKALIEENHRSLRRQTAEFMAYGGPARPQLEGLFDYTLRQCSCGRPVCMVGALAVDFEELDEDVRRALNRFGKDTLDWLSRVLQDGREQGELDFRGDARSKAASILATLQGARQLARIHGQELLERMIAQIRTDLAVSE